MTKRSKVFFNATLASSMLLLAIAGTAAAQTRVPGVPEIDAGSVASAMTLIIGAALFLKDKFRTKQE